MCVCLCLSHIANQDLSLLGEQGSSIGLRNTSSAKVSVGMSEWARHHPADIKLLMHSQTHQSLC